MIKGFDYLGIASKHWDLDMTIRLTPPNVIWGGFDCGADKEEDVFGELLPAFEKVHASGKSNQFRVQLSWNRHKLTPIRSMIRLLPDWEKFAVRTGSKVFISHSTEYTSKDKDDVNRRITLVRKMAPSCIPVSNPSGGGYWPKDTKLERHHDVIGDKGNIISLDGMDIHGVECRDWLKENRIEQVYACLAWRYEFNMENEATYGQIPHNQRTRSPTAAELKDTFKRMGFR